MKIYRILYRFKGNSKYNDIPHNEGFVEAFSKKEAKAKFIKLMNEAECEAKIIRIID